MNRQLWAFVGALLVMSHPGVAWGDEMSSIQDSLLALDVKCKVTDNGEEIVGSIPVAENKSYGVFVEKETFIRNGRAFRMVWGGLMKRCRANELTEDQLEILVRNPVPANADGNTLKTAMWMCASLLGEVDGKISEKSELVATAHAERPSAPRGPQKPEISTGSPAPKTTGSTASADDISDILAKAEAHDGIVIDGFYLGMSADDAQRVAAHVLGVGFEPLQWTKYSWNEYYWYYFIGGSPSEWGGGDQENKIGMLVSKKNGKVEQFHFRAPAIRKLIGVKQPISIEGMGRKFFAHFDLEGTLDYEGNINMKTPEGELIRWEPNNGTGRIWWGK